MFHSIVYLSLAVALACALCQVNWRVQANEAWSETVEQVCSPEAAPFGFTSPEQVRDLIKIFKVNKSKCPKEHEAAFESLAEVLDDEVLEDVCGPVAYDRIRQFHLRYISRYTPEATKADLDEARKLGADALEPIPESLRRFFILFALQINGQCKRSLVQRLEREVDDLVTDEEFALMRRMKSEGSRLMGDEYREQAKRLKDLVILTGGAADGAAKLYVQVRFGDVIKRAKDACESKFRPIYEELFVPVIRLHNLGYKDTLNSEKENEELDTVKRYTRWFGIIETCEILKDIEVIQDSSSLSAVADLIQANSLLFTARSEAPKLRADLRRIRLLSEEEASTLKDRIAKDIELHKSVSVHEVKGVELAHERLAFTPRMWLLEEQQRKQEMKNFDHRVQRLISRKTSLFHLTRKALALMLRRKFHRHRLQIESRDESSALGKIATFMDRHQAGVRLACAIIGLIVVVSVFTG